jgi:hypothetical protein
MNLAFFWPCCGLMGEESLILAGWNQGAAAQVGLAISARNVLRTNLHCSNIALQQGEVMVRWFLGKGNNPNAAPSVDAAKPRGLDVIEEDDADPETVWGMWEEAVAEQESRLGALEDLKLPEIHDFDQATRPMAYDDFHERGDTRPTTLKPVTPLQRKTDALDVIDLHHLRIANTIRSLWGHKECNAYINGLIMSGGDGMGHARIGFSLEVVDAMLTLLELHGAEFGY